MTIQPATCWREIKCICEFHSVCVYWHSFLLLCGRNTYLSYTSLNIKKGCSYIQKKNAENNEGCVLCAARKEGAGILMFFVYSRSSFRVIFFFFCFLFIRFLFFPFLSFNLFNFTYIGMPVSFLGKSVLTMLTLFSWLTVKLTDQHYDNASSSCCGTILIECRQSLSTPSTCWRSFIECWALRRPDWQPSSLAYKFTFYTQKNLFSLSPFLCNYLAYEVV